MLKNCYTCYTFYTVILANDPPEGKMGLMLGGRISSNDITYSQELEDGCSVVGLPNQKAAERHTFVITSADYCNRDGEPLKYNQEFLLTLSSSINKQVNIWKCGFRWALETLLLKALYYFVEFFTNTPFCAMKISLSNKREHRITKHKENKIARIRKNLILKKGTIHCEGRKFHSCQ